VRIVNQDHFFIGFWQSDRLSKDILGVKAQYPTKLDDIAPSRNYPKTIKEIKHYSTPLG